MSHQESPEEKKERFKMKVQGLIEGSGIPGKDLFSYDREDIWELIQITRCFPEMQSNRRFKKLNHLNRKKKFVSWMLFIISLMGGMLLYLHNYPSTETRREISVDGIFLD